MQIEIFGQEVVRKQLSLLFVSLSPIDMRWRVKQNQIENMPVTN